MAIDKTKRGTAISANVPFALAQAVYAEVKNGRHDSAGGVVRAALRQYLGLDEDDQPLPAAPPAGTTAVDDAEPAGDASAAGRRARRRHRDHLSP